MENLEVRLNEKMYKFKFPNLDACVAVSRIIGIDPISKEGVEIMDTNPTELMRDVKSSETMKELLDAMLTEPISIEEVRMIMPEEVNAALVRFFMAKIVITQKRLGVEMPLGASQQNGQTSKTPQVDTQSTVSSCSPVNETQAE